MWLQIIPFIQFSAPSVSPRPSFLERLGETLASSVIAGGARIAEAHVAGGLANRRARELAEFQAGVREREDLAQNYRPLTEDIETRAANINYELAPRVAAGQRYIPLSDLEAIEAREYEAEPVEIPGAGSFRRGPAQMAIQAGTMARAILASPTERTAVASELEDARRSRLAVGQTAGNLGQLLTAVNEGQVTLAELDDIQQAAVHGTRAVLEGTQLAFNKEIADREYNLDLNTKAIKATLETELVNSHTGRKLRLDPFMARQWLEGSEDARIMQEGGWRVELLPEKLDFHEWVTKEQQNLGISGASSFLIPTYVSIVKQSGQNTYPGREDPLEDREVASILQADFRGRTWIGGWLLTQMFPPQAGGWRALLDAARRGVLPDAVTEHTGYIESAEAFYRLLNDPPPDNLVEMIGTPGLIPDNILEPGALKVDPPDPDAPIKDRSGEAIGTGPTGMTRSGELTYTRPAYGPRGVGAGAVVGKRIVEALQDFGLIPESETPTTPEQAATVTGAVPQILEDSAGTYTQLVQRFADDITESPADTTSIFVMLSAMQRNPMLAREELLRSIDERQDLSPEEKAEARAEVAALRPDEDPADAALLNDIALQWINAYTEALDIANRRLSTQPQQ